MSLGELALPGPPFCRNLAGTFCVMGRFFEEFWPKISGLLKLLIKSISESGLVRGLELAALVQWLWQYWYVTLGAALLAILVITSARSSTKNKWPKPSVPLSASSR